MILYPGSFSILHRGHLEIANFVENKYKQEVIFEICVCPFDKPKLTQEDIDNRKSQFTNLGRVCITSNNNSFIGKITNFSLEKYPNETIYFVVGHDTIERIGQLKYYHDCESELKRCIRIFAKKHAKFLVFPRNGKLMENIYPELVKLCEFQSEFQEINISSTKLSSK